MSMMGLLLLSEDRSTVLPPYIELSVSHTEERFFWGTNSHHHYVVTSSL